MEVKSTALDAYIEGEVVPKGGTNVWVSLPVNNLGKKPSEIVPEKGNYADTKSKVYLELKDDKNNDLKMKFHLSKKKFYEHRGIKEKFKKDRQKHKRFRKEKQN